MIRDIGRSLGLHEVPADLWASSRGINVTSRHPHPGRQAVALVGQERVAPLLRTEAGLLPRADVAAVILNHQAATTPMVSAGLLPTAALAGGLPNVAVGTAWIQAGDSEGILRLLVGGPVGGRQFPLGESYFLGLSQDWLDYLRTHYANCGGGGQFGSRREDAALHKRL